MPQANSVDPEKIARTLCDVRLMIKHLEEEVKQKLANSTPATGNHNSAKAGTSLSYEDMDFAQLQQKILALLAKAIDDHEPANAKALDDLSLEGMDFAHKQQQRLANSTKTTAAHRILKPLDYDKLEGMNLAYWQEERSGQHSTEANLDLETVKSLEYLDLKGMDLAYLQQQRLVQCPRAVIGTNNG